MNKNNLTINVLIDRYRRIIVSFFFIAYLGIGVSVFGDYGVSWDENLSKRNGVVALNYIFTGSEELFAHPERYHGPTFEMFLVIAGRIINPFGSIRLLYLLRHLFTFILYFIGVVFFYKLCKKIFDSWKIGLSGSLFLILSPRIFAHSFYNSKDIPFLSLFIISAYTLVRFLEDKSPKKAAIHALACAFLIDIRVLGVLMPFLTILFVLSDVLVYKISGIKVRKISISVSVYVFLLVSLTLLFWPLLWRKPLYHFIEAFRQMGAYPWQGKILYLGNYIDVSKLPWHYIPVWILISTPVLYIACFLTGCFIFLKKILNNPAAFYATGRNYLIFMLWFLLPLAGVILGRSVLYDAWRHMFFVYPAFIAISLMGLIGVFQYITAKLRGATTNALRLFFVFAIAVNLLNTAYFMIRYHPFQNVYFNAFAGNAEKIKNNFELDYWGLSYRQALEYILKNDKNQTIKVYVASLPGEYNANILPYRDKERLVYVKDPAEAKYFLSNYRWHREEYPYTDEFYSIKVNGFKIMVVYKIGT
ncbi:MAG: glycosyltransferase family 39 protein [Candidatus Omnitrophica bacterium]|nr:glycosyltransferase family 39 protein [Candidatus Omnitrophota bacterium]MDD5355830.1 glycosyltransferase family 39 protein [Candidatus Omnitrophota bacterium]